MIKFYAWEEPFRAQVMAARDEETKLLKKSTFWMALFGMLLFSGPVMVAVFCFASYTLAGNILSTAGGAGGAQAWAGGAGQDAALREAWFGPLCMLH